MHPTTPVRTLDEQQTVSFQVPVHLSKWLEEHAASRCSTKSQVLRALVLDLKERTEAKATSTADADALGATPKRKAIR